jgi:hypothetical protein
MAAIIDVSAKGNVEVLEVVGVSMHCRCGGSRARLVVQNQVPGMASHQGKPKLPTDANVAKRR